MEKVFVTSASLQKRYNAAIVFATLLGIVCVARGIYLLFSGINPISGPLLTFMGAIQFLWVWITSVTVKTTNL